MSGVSKITMDVVIECSKSTRTKLSQYIKCCGGNLDLVGSGADLERVSGWGGGNPSPLNFQNIHLVEQYLTFQDFRHYQYFCVRISKCFARLLLYLISMKVYLCHVTILRKFCLLSWNLQVIFASSYIFCICAEQQPPWYIPVHSHLVVKVLIYKSPDACTMYIKYPKQLIFFISLKYNNT